MLELAICDDDIILCNWLEQKLLHYGKANDCQISIEIYYSAEQLLNRLEEESYDMLFLDICLGHENGIDIDKIILLKESKLIKDNLYLLKQSQDLSENKLIHLTNQFNNLKNKINSLSIGRKIV